MASIERCDAQPWRFSGLYDLGYAGTLYYAERAISGPYVKWLLYDRHMCGIGIFDRMVDVEDHIVERHRPSGEEVS